MDVQVTNRIRQVTNRIRRNIGFMMDMLLGGVSGAIVKTAMAPVERVKLLLQTQDSNPKVISGEIPKYTGIGDCFARVSAEQGALFLDF